MSDFLVSHRLYVELKPMRDNSSKAVSLHFAQVDVFTVSLSCEMIIINST